MHYEGNIIRPPSEADSILLQVTTGCSHNECTFCGVYKDKPFTIKDKDIIESDLIYASIHCKDQSKLFLCDGDALILPQIKLIELLKKINHYLPWVTRIGTYANAKSISHKSIEELKELRALGLRIIHMGLESGDDTTLANVGKWGNSRTLIEQGRKVIDAGINLFLTVLLGLGGRDRSLVHAEETGKVLSAIDPNYVGALSLMLLENTPLYKKARVGEFSILTPEELLMELRRMLECTSMSHGYFYANHASNYLPLRVRLPREKAQALSLIDRALQGNVQLTPEWMRGL